MQSKQVAISTEHLSRAFISTAAILSVVQSDQLDIPTPCASWDVRDLITHFVGSARWATAAILGDEIAPEYIVGSDFLACYDESMHAALAAFGSGGAPEKAVLSLSEVSGAALMGIATGDQFTHVRDLARALGHHTDLDPELADALPVQAQGMIPEESRGPNGAAPFGPIVAPPAGASPADRLAAFLGRSM
jgi:uncharacterized protein (TIGR03086 family)